MIFLRRSSLGLALLLAACAPGASLKRAQPTYDGRAGGFEVLELPELRLPGSADSSPLEVRAHVPVGEGPFPVIVFSHGAWGANDEYRGLMRFWASHGYVTLQPNHSDSRALGIKVGDRAVTRAWRNRPTELGRLIDGLPRLEAEVLALAGRLDGERLGIAGHSAGAATALQLGGAGIFVGGEEVRMGHPKVRAVVALASPPLGGTLREASFARLRLPLLAIAGSLDAPNRGEKDPRRRRAAFDLSPPGGKYLLWVEGMDHGLGGLQGPEAGPDEAEDALERRLVAIASLAFWDATLKDSDEAQRYLRSGALTRLSGDTATIEWK